MFSQHHLRLLLLLIAFALAGALGWRLVRGQSPLQTGPELASKHYERAIEPPPTPEAVAARGAEIDARVSSAPEYAGFADRVARAYPAEWSAVLDEAARRSLAARRIESPDFYVSAALRALRRDRGVMASKAGPEALAHVFDAQEKIIGGLAGADKRLCVDFMLGETSPAFLDYMTRNRALMAEMANASLDAMIDGDARKIDRAPPSDADFDAIEAALANHGLGAPEIHALLDGRLPEPAIPDQSLCDAGLVYFDVLRGLPDDVRERVYALAVRTMGRS